MTGLYRAIVWIDQREARVVSYKATEVKHVVLRSDQPSRPTHRNANGISNGHAWEDHVCLQRVAEAIMDAAAVVITGPEKITTEFPTYIERHTPALAAGLHVSRPPIIRAAAG